MTPFAPSTPIMSECALTVRGRAKARAKRMEKDLLYISAGEGGEGEWFVLERLKNEGCVVRKKTA